MSTLFWLSIVLWMTALVAYALILGGLARNRGPLYRVITVAAVGAMVTGGMYLLTLG